VKTESKINSSRKNSIEIFKKKDFPQLNFENLNMCDTTGDTNYNIIGRSSTASLPLTETQKRIKSDK